MRNPAHLDRGLPSIRACTARALVGALSALILFPWPLSSQDRRGKPAPAPDLRALSICAMRPPLQGGVWNTVLGALGASDRESWRPAVRALEDSLAAAAAAAPADVTTQYLYAVALGARTEVEDGRREVRKAVQLGDQLERVLRLDPDHAGALHILGRLNAAVMRLGSLKRFLATKLLGGAALSSASWDEARRLLEAAVEKDPCVPDHHLELAKLFTDTGYWTLARAELDWVILLATDDDNGVRTKEKARSLLKRLGTEEEGEG